MNDYFFTAQANDDFNRARKKQIFSTILSFRKPRRQDLLSLAEVREILKPKKETYRGLQVVPIKKIIGSEGRYKDFSRAFLPKYSHIRHRWVPIDKAHLKNEVLPAIKLYKIGDVYFVRDGNHRVSVAAMQEVESIDAEVIELDSEIDLQPGMTTNDLKKAVILYERDRFFTQTGLDSIIDRDELTFSATGRYLDIIEHIKTHKYFLDINQKKNTPFIEAARFWHETVFLPIVVTIQTENVLSQFPGRTVADLYVWIVRHWDELKKQYGPGFSINSAVRDFSKRFGKNFFQRLKAFFSRN